MNSGRPARQRLGQPWLLLAAAALALLATLAFMFTHAAVYVFSLLVLCGAGLLLAIMRRRVAADTEPASPRSPQPGSPAVAPRSTTEAISPTAAALEHIGNATGLDVATAQARLGNTRLYLAALQQAQAVLTQWPIRFAESAHNNDVQATRRVAHDLRGLCATIGADALARQAAALEAAILAGDTDPKQVQALAEGAATLGNALATALAHVQAAVAGEVGPGSET